MYANFILIKENKININPPIVIGPISIPATRLDKIKFKEIVLKVYKIMK